MLAKTEAKKWSGTGIGEPESAYLIAWALIVLYFPVLAVMMRIGDYGNIGLILYTVVAGAIACKLAWKVKSLITMFASLHLLLGYPLVFLVLGDFAMKIFWFTPVK